MISGKGILDLQKLRICAVW